VSHPVSWRAGARVQKGRPLRTLARVSYPVENAGFADARRRHHFRTLGPDVGSNAGIGLVGGEPANQPTIDIVAVFALPALVTTFYTYLQLTPICAENRGACRMSLISYFLGRSYTPRQSISDRPSPDPVALPLIPAKRPVPLLNSPAPTCRNEFQINTSRIVKFEPSLNR
jgi:hypothetical protein